MSIIPTDPTTLTTTSTGSNGKTTRSKRSKNGCVSCKHLKIKCTEEKPFCEYCLHTGRQCIYFQKPSVKLKVFKTKLGRPQRKKSYPGSSAGGSGNTSGSEDSIPIINTSDCVKHMNSPTVQLEVSQFELQLLKFYLEFGADFFTFNVSSKSHRFWEFEVPQLWCSSDLIKNALYTLCCVRLLANYEENAYKNVHIEYDNSALHSGELVSAKSQQSVNLLERGKHYLSKTNEMMDLYQLMLSDEQFTEGSEDIVGQLLISNLCLTVVTGMMAIEDGIAKTPIDTNDISHFRIFEMIQIFKDFQILLNNRYSIIKSTKYNHMFTGSRSGQITPTNIDPYPWSNFLRRYVIMKLDSLDVLQISCLNLISRIETSCHAAIASTAPMALINPIREVFLDEDLLEAFKKGHDIVMKIMYYSCAILAIFDYKLTKGCTVWNELINFYRDRAFAKYGGKFEDDWDYNLYNTLIARRECKILYDLNLINYLGRPVEDFFSGKIVLQKKSYPSVFF